MDVYYKPFIQFDTTSFRTQGNSLWQSIICYDLCVLLKPYWWCIILCLKKYIYEAFVKRYSLAWIFHNDMIGNGLVSGIRNEQQHKVLVINLNDLWLGNVQILKLHSVAPFTCMRVCISQHNARSAMKICRKRPFIPGISRRSTNMKLWHIQ